MSLIGHERTRVRRALAALIEAHPSPESLARAIGIRRHTAKALIERRMLPGRRTAEAIEQHRAAMSQPT